MTDIEDLEERLVGERFYDSEQDEAFTVVGFTPAPPLALLQYDDGVAWDEAASAFTVDADTAAASGLDEDGLDAARYRPLGPGPRIDRICPADGHEWTPWPDQVWPNGPTPELRSAVEGRPRDRYTRLARCSRCGLSGDVAGQFGFYGSDGSHGTPWFCTDCGDAFTHTDLVYRGDFQYCRDCAPAEDDPIDDE